MSLPGRHAPLGAEVGSEVESEVESEVGSEFESEVGSGVALAVESEVGSDVALEVESEVGSEVESEFASEVESGVKPSAGRRKRCCLHVIPTSCSQFMHVIISPCVLHRMACTSHNDAAWHARHIATPHDMHVT